MSAHSRISSRHAQLRLRIASAAFLVALMAGVLPQAVFASRLGGGSTVSSPAAAAAGPARPTSPRPKPAPSEIVSERTENSTTYDNHDGTFTTYVHPGPVNYRAGDGSWQPINRSFAAADENGRVAAARTTLPVQVGPADDPAGFLAVSSHGHTIRLSLTGDATPGVRGAKPRVTGSQADLAGLLPGVDLRVFAGATTASSFLVLNDQSAGSSFTFRLDAPGLTSTLNPDGTITFADAHGAVVATMPAPYAVDSTIDPHLGSGRTTNQVSYELVKHGGQTFLTVSVDPAWLAGATFPVYVDPTFKGTSQVTDNFVSSKYPTTAYPNYQRPDSPYYHELWLGMDPTNSSNVNYDYISFDLSSQNWWAIDSAILEVYPYHQYYAAPTQVTTWVNKVNAAWNTSTLTWNNQPGASTNITSANTVQGSYGSFTVTSTVQNWVSNPGTNYGFMLNEDGYGGTYWKRLISSEDSTGDGPMLVVTSHRPTGTASSPTGGAWTNSRTVSWTYSDPNGQAQTDSSVNVATSSSFGSSIIYSIAHTHSSAQNYTYPGTVALSDGATYWWEIQVADSGGGWSTWSAASFRWDGTAPAWNGFTAPTAATTYVNAASYAFSWNAASDPASGLRQYEVVPQSAPLYSTGVCTNASWTNMTGNQVTTATNFTLGSLADNTCYRLAVRSLDNAGNYSGYAYSNPILVDHGAPSNPILTASGTNAYQAAANGTVWFNPNVAGSFTLTSSSTDSVSGVAGHYFGGPIVSASGWSPPGAWVWANPASRVYSWSVNAASTIAATHSQDAAGNGDVNDTDVNVTADASAPTGAFSAPADGALILQAGTSYTVAWTAADGQSGVASQSLQRQKAAPVTSGSCTGASWANDGSPTSAGSPLSVSGLLTGTCYRWVLSATDHVGNVGTDVSGSLLIDTATPNLPDVAGTGSGVYQAGTDGTVYVNPATASSVGLTSSVTPIPASGIAEITYGNLTPADGWTPTPPLPNAATTSPYVESLRVSPSIAPSSIDVTVTNGAGTSSATRTLSLTPDAAAPTADFATPAAGTTTAQGSGVYTVAWTEADADSGVAGRSIQRQMGAVASAGTCDGVSWANDGSPSTAPSPLAVTGLTDGCYRWLITLTDNVSNATTWTSGALLIDTTAPSAAIAYPEANRPLAGDVVVTGTATDTNLASYTLDEGAGSAPSSWTTIVTASSPVPTTGALGAWSTGSLTGTYTLRLRATDAAGNTTSVSHLVYLDNSRHGASGTANVPFDLGGGWDLGVNATSGEASLARELFSIPSYGPSQALTLTYNSADQSGAGAFGTGWSSNLTQYLASDSGFIIWHRADGSQVPFGQIGGVWTPLAGSFETLVSEGSGYRITERDRSSTLFDGTGRLAAIADRYGSALSLAWGATSATATDASGRATTLSIDAANARITDVLDSAGRHWGFGYTGSDLTSISNPAGKVTTLAYDGAHELTGVSRTRTPASGPAQTITWSLAYANGQVSSVTDPIGGAASPAASSTFAYSLGSTTVNLLRDASNPAAPLNATSTYGYESHGWVTSETDPAGWVTNTAYDAYGDPTSTSRQVSATAWATTSATYDAAGNVVSTTDPVGAVTTTTYRTVNGFLTSDPILKTQAAGSPIALATLYVYDAAGHRCRKVVNPTGDPGSIACTGALSGAADQNTDTQDTYNAQNELTSETDARGTVTSYAYDAYGDRTSTTRNAVSGATPDDATNITTTDAYDQATTAGKIGLVTSETVPITTVGSGLSRTTTKSYDALGDMLTETEPGDSATPSLRTVNTYDEFGNLLTTTTYAPSDASSALSTLTNVYDARDRLATTTNVTSTATTTTSTTYDVAGDALVVTNPDGTTVTKTYDPDGRVASEQSSAIGLTSHTYDGLGDETETIAPAEGTATLVTERTFDAAGRLASQTIDATGTPATSSYVHDLLGRETSATDPAGLVTTTSYDATGRMTRSVAGTAITDTTYDKAGDVVTVSAPYAAGATPVITATAYDALGRPGTSTANAVAGSLDPTANLVTKTFYDAAGDAVATVDPKGIVTRSMFDVRSELAETIGNCTDTGTTPSANPPLCKGAGTHDGTTNTITSYTYAGNGTKVSSTTQVGALTTTDTYDGAGRVVTSIVDPGAAPHLNLETDTAYDTAGRILATKSPAGVVNVTVYDTAGRILKSIVNCTDATPGALPGANWATCSAAGPKDGTWNQTTTYAYDGAGNKTRETAPNGITTAFTYDAKGEQTSQTLDYEPGYVGTDPTVNVTSYTYWDAAGRKIASTTPTAAGSYAITRDLYDTSGNLTAEILNCTSSGTTPDANPATCTGAGAADATTNIRTTYSYDAAGHKLAMSAPSPANGASGTAVATTDYAYDANGRLCRVLQNATVDLASLADPCHVAVAGSSTTNVSTRYDYTPTGQLADQVAPAPAGTTSYAYDAAGRLTGSTDADGNTVSLSYDAAGNKIAETDPDTASGPTISYAYDVTNRLCRRLGASPGVALSSLANPCTDTVAGATIDTRYTYDAAGNVLTATDALTGEQISSTYDPLNRPLTVSGDTTVDPGTSYTYDLVNPRRTEPSGTYSITLDHLGREATLVDPLHSGGGGVFSWAYAASGAVAKSGDPTGSTTTNTYDALGRLTSRVTGGSAACTACASYALAYNDAGAELSRSSAIAGDPTNGTSVYTYDPLARLTGYTPPTTQPQAYAWNGLPDRASVQTGTAAPVTVTFDGASRPVADSLGNTYTSDREGRITTIPGKALVYDALGRLTSVKAMSDGSTLAAYTYDPLDRLRTVTEAGSTSRIRYVGRTSAVAQLINDATGAVISDHATDLQGVELSDFSPDGTSQAYLGRNPHDDVTWTADASGAVSSTAAYDPFGTLVSSTGSVPQDRWQGSFEDPVTGLYYVVARWYAPSLGTFTSQDSQLGSPTNPATRDLYAYGAGDAIDRVDSSGNSWLVAARTFDLDSFDTQANWDTFVQIGCTLADYIPHPAAKAISLGCSVGWQVAKSAIQRINRYTIHRLNYVAILKDSFPNSITFVRSQGVKTIDNQTGRAVVSWARMPLLQYTEIFDYDSRPIMIATRQLHDNWVRCGEASALGIREWGPGSPGEAASHAAGYCGGYYSRRIMWWPNIYHSGPASVIVSTFWPNGKVECGRYTWGPTWGAWCN